MSFEVGKAGHVAFSVDLVLTDEAMRTTAIALAGIAPTIALAGIAPRGVSPSRVKYCVFMDVRNAGC